MDTSKALKTVTTLCSKKRILPAGNPAKIGKMGNRGKGYRYDS